MLQLTDDEKKEVKTNLKKLEGKPFSKEDLENYFPNIKKLNYAKDIILNLIDAGRVSYTTTHDGKILFSIIMGSKKDNCKRNK